MIVALLGSDRRERRYIGVYSIIDNGDRVAIAFNKDSKTGVDCQGLDVFDKEYVEEMIVWQEEKNGETTG